MSYIPHISISDYTYELPEDRIALKPTGERDESKLLVCDVTSGTITHRVFPDIVSLIPPGALLIANDTKVVRARMKLKKVTGGEVEFLLLEPVLPSTDPVVTLTSRGTCTWKCLIGGAKKLRDSEVSGEFEGGGVHARVILKRPDHFLVRFRWEPQLLEFAEVLESVGRVPLPPYINRRPVLDDIQRYQTVYAEHLGAVAAPTAGLHFTTRVMDALRDKGVAFERVTLHVGAGTFRPVKGDVDKHAMHEEQVHIPMKTIRAIAEQVRRRDAGEHAPLVIVGTTSLRTVESLYWFGVRLVYDDAGARNSALLSVGQWDPYRLGSEHASLPTATQSLDAVLEWATANNLEELTGVTGIFIVPGYKPMLCDAIITNFHQPESTLLLLVGALTGKELLERIYTEALEGGYRFLSYGDCSLVVLSSEF